MASKSKHHIDIWVCKSRNPTRLEITYRRSLAYRWHLGPLLNSYLKFYIYISSQLYFKFNFGDNVLFIFFGYFRYATFACRWIFANNDISTYSSLLCLTLSSRQLHISYPISWFVLTQFFCLSPCLFSSPHLP